VCVRFILGFRVRAVRQDGDVSPLLGVADGSGNPQESHNMGLEEFEFLFQWFYLDGLR